MTSTSLKRVMRLGAGVASLGYGLYRFSRGRRDWLTTTAITTGLTVTLDQFAAPGHAGLLASAGTVVKNMIP